VADPPGGPPDTLPPQILRIQPESGALVPNWKGDAEIFFDDVIDEMATGGGGAAAGGLARQVLLSPVSGGVKVDWHRSRVTVKPREGWKKRVYRLEVLPGIVDLRRNRLDTGKVVLFSTGPEIGHARIGGIALGWVEQRILPRALIEAVPLPDSIGYLTQTDSGGQFNLESLAPGKYIVYAVNDENGDRRRGLREAYDSTAVTLDSSANVALFAFVHDTNPPRIRTAQLSDSISIRVEFSQPLDPVTPLDTMQTRVLELPDSTPIRVARVVPQRVFDSLTAVARQRADSLKAAQDTTKRQTPAAPAQPRQARQPPTAAKLPPVDTALVRKLLATRPVPTDRYVITLMRPLKPETRYVIDIQGATNLVGNKGSGQVVLLVPKPVARDTTQKAPSPGDTTQGVPRTPPPPSPPR
jgi:hypothetical protein